MKEKDKESQSVIITRLIEETNYRTAQNIDSWRSAITQAESLENPDYIPFYQLCREIELDGHIHGLISQRLNRLLGAQFRIVNEKGEEQPDAWKLFETSWFYRFLELAMESRWWHHSLIQLWDVRENGYGQVQVVNRNHVLPRTGQVSLRQMDTTSAVNYREPVYYDWLVECGDPKDLGLFNRAAPLYLIKKNALREWSKFAQLFGMPIRVGKTASKLKNDMDRMATNLKMMEAAAYGVFQEGENIEFIESTKGDAYQVYKELILTPNAELSKLFLGQTMTTDNGSSKSQGEVHERVADGIAEADKRFIQFLVNDELIPRMIKHGFKLEGMRFEWAPTKDLKQQMEMVSKLLQFKNVPNDYIEETFGIPVEDKQAATEPAPGKEPDGNKQPVVKKKDKVSLIAELDALYKGSCDHVHLSSGDQPETIDIDALAAFIYNNQNNPDVLHDDTYLKTARSLMAGFKGGYSTAFEDDGATEVRARIQQNLYPFSAAKTLVQMNEMRSMLEKDGKLLSLDEFRNAVAAKGVSFNRNYLNAEYNHAVASGQMAARWQQYQQDAELYPNLRYETAGDERVRDEHSKLDGIVKPINDKFWDTYYPPNDWGCRCDVTQMDADTPVDEGYPKDSRKIVPALFRNNVGKTSVVFTDGHPYMQVEGEKAKLLNYKNYNLKPLPEVKRLKQVSVENLSNRKQFDKWVEMNSGLEMFDGELVGFDKRAIKKQAGYNDGQHWEVSSNVSDLLMNPSESYQLSDPQSGVITRTFLKHYKDRTIVAAAELRNNEWLLQTWFEWDGKQVQDDKRQGALIWLIRK